MRFVMVDTTPLAFLLAAQGHGIALARAPATDAMVQVMGLHRLPCLSPVSGQQRYYLLQPEARATRRATLVLRDWILTAAQPTGMG